MGLLDHVEKQGLKDQQAHLDAQGPKDTKDTMDPEVYLFSINDSFEIVNQRLFGMHGTVIYVV